VETPKIVFSKTINQSPWNNTTLFNGELVPEIKALKQQGSDIMVYGGGELMSVMISEKLIDEGHLFINPVVLGNGIPIFQGVSGKQDYALVSAISFGCGIVEITYNPC